MAGRLHVRYVKIVPAGGDLDAATPLDVTNQAVTFSVEDVLVEHIITTNPNPAERYAIGTRFSLKAQLAYDDDSQLTYLLGGTYGNGIYHKPQEIRTLPLRDLRLEVYRTDTEIVNYDFNDVHFIPKFESSFEQGKRTYLSFEIMGTATTEMTIDNTPA